MFLLFLFSRIVSLFSLILLSLVFHRIRIFSQLDLLLRFLSYVEMRALFYILSVFYSFRLSPLVFFLFLVMFRNVDDGLLRAAAWDRCLKAHRQPRTDI